MSDIADQQEINRLNAKVEALEGENAALKDALDRAGNPQLPAPASAYVEMRNRAERLRVALTIAKEAADERRAYCQAWEWKYKAQWDEEDAAICKALEDAAQ